MLLKFGKVTCTMHSKADAASDFFSGERNGIDSKDGLGVPLGLLNLLVPKNLTFCRKTIYFKRFCTCHFRKENKNKKPLLMCLTLFRSFSQFLTEKGSKFPNLFLKFMIRSNIMFD